MSGSDSCILNSNYGRGLDWIKTENFEQSPDFSKKVHADITNIFDYVQYQDIFESNGEVDYSKVVLEVTTGPGGEKTYTLDDIIQYGKSLGYYMDESDNYALKGGPESPLCGRSGPGLCPLPLLPG